MEDLTRHAVCYHACEWKYVEALMAVRETYLAQQGVGDEACMLHMQVLACTVFTEKDVQEHCEWTSVG